MFSFRYWIFLAGSALDCSVASSGVLLKQGVSRAIATLHTIFEHDSIPVLQLGMPDVHTVKEKEIKHILDMIIAAIRKYVPQEYRILLFGSWARSGANPTSDIDIALSGPAKVDSLIMARIRQDIEELPTLRKLDIVDIHSVDEEFRETILKDAVVIG